MSEEQGVLALTDTDQVDVLAILEQEFLLIDERQDQAFPNWYLAQINKIDACRAKVKEQAKIIQAELDTRQRGLEYLYYNAFKESVEIELSKPENSKKKSINFLNGKAGTRKSRDKLVVTDEAKAVSWALDNDCGGAVDMKLARTTPLMDAYAASKVVPDGCDFIKATESFFPGRTQPALAMEEKAKELEQKENENE